MKNSNKNYSNFSDDYILNQYFQEKEIQKSKQAEEDNDESIIIYVLIIAIWLIIYGITYFFKIELNLWYSIISNFLAIIAIYHIIRIVDGKYWGTKNRESFYRKFYKTIFIIIMISLIPLGVYLKSKHYYRNRIYLEKAPIEIPPSLMNANKNTFFSELKNYEDYNTPQRLFYFDLQWSLRYAKNAKQKAQYQRLEQLYMQRKSSGKVQLDILSYNLYEALLNETNKDSILHYINQIHPGNVYEMKYVRFRRIAQSRHDIAATPEEEESLSYGDHRNVQTNSRRPRGLLQAIENLKLFTKEEKTQMLEHVLKCLVQWAIENECPQEAINKFTSRFLTPNSGWYISHYIGKGIGMYEVEESLWKMRNALFDSIPESKIFSCYSLEDWGTFIKSKKQ